jgi:hypothetical protein
MTPDQTSIASQQLGKHVAVATDTHVTIEELLEKVFSMGSVQNLYNENQDALTDWSSVVM